MTTTSSMIPGPGQGRHRHSTLQAGSIVVHDVTDWRDVAACKGRTELFFGPVAERPEARMRRENKAQRLCDGCAVAGECREFAREHREYGYWGAETEETRHLLGYTLTAPIGMRSRRHREPS